MLSRRAFTLIELLVVIAIIGVLSSIVLSHINAARSRARDVKKLQDYRNFVTGFELYSMDHDDFPVGPEFINITSSSPDWNTYLGGALQPYMSTIPTPTSGSPYFYTGNYQGSGILTNFCSSDGCIEIDESCSYFYIPVESPNATSIGDGGVYNNKLEIYRGKGCTIN